MTMEFTKFAAKQTFVEEINTCFLCVLDCSDFDYCMKNKTKKFNTVIIETMERVFFLSTFFVAYLFAFAFINAVEKMPVRIF